MSIFKKSKYKKSHNWDWWDAAEEERVVATGGTSYGGGYNSGYNDYGYGKMSTWWKPKYDMSFSLETRVSQLIQTITGKRLRLVEAGGWGSDDDHFYYNGKDLQDITDDEVLGRILQMLAKELYIDKPSVAELHNSQPEYRHLLDTLETNRADRSLQDRYLGCRYYASELWDNRKFSENPMSKYQDSLKFEEWLGKMYGQDIPGKYNRGDFGKQQMMEMQIDYQRYIANLDSQQNDSWEFCFNINAFQNGEKDFDFSKEKMGDNFALALPFIDEYLKARTFADALKVYPDIQKYYPKPNKQQQQQMDAGMEGMAGLSQQQMASMQKQAKVAQANSSGKSADASDIFDVGQYDENGEYQKAHGYLGSLNPGTRTDDPDLAEYKRLRALNAGTIGALHALIRSILKDNQIRRYTRPYKRGKIDAKRMYKYVSTGDLRIFKKQQQIKDVKYTMAILVDQSGSMGGQNSEYAVQGAIILAEVFEMLGLPYEVMGFDDQAFVYKNFSKPLRRELMPNLRTSMGGTDDHNALAVLLDHAKKFDPQTHYRKGFFVISDGEGADPKKMQELVTDIETHHKATVFGIGIGDMKETSLKQTYNHWLRVKDTKDLPTALVNIMRGQFRRQ